MVSTRRSMKSRQVVQEDTSASDSGEDYHPEEDGPDSVVARGPKSRASTRTTSKQKGKQHQKRRNAGKLSRLPDMPLDILYEIFSLVHPADLLRMSWASKPFRSVLTNKSSRQVWVAAFGNISITMTLRPPPCPEYLTEIAYANLLYNPCCMGCGALRAPANWEALVRVCMGCIKDWVIIAGGVEDQAVIPLSRDKIHSSSQVLPVLYIKIPPLSKRLYVFTKDLKRLKADLMATEDEAAVIQRYKDALVMRSEFAQKLERLESMEKFNREITLRAARDKRIDQILERLADQGWNEEISSNREEYIHRIVQERGVRVARPLTEKAWEEMETRILDAMRTCKQEIENKTLKTRCTSRVGKMVMIVIEYERTLEPYDFCPSTEDVCRLPDIRKVIIDGTDEEFNTCAKEVTSRLPKLTSQLLKERTTKMSALLPFNGRSDSTLLLAKAWFRCGKCDNKSPMHATDALRHYCSFLWCYPYGKSIGEATLDVYMQRRRWCGDTDRLQFSGVTSAIARGLILDCGEDPESITLTEINAKFHRFFICRSNNLVAYNWRETFNYKSSNPSSYHRFLGPDECPEFVYDPNAYNGERLWNCLHCRRRIGAWTFGSSRFATLPTVKQHIIVEHGVGTPAEDMDYFFNDRHRPPKFIRVIQEQPASANPLPL